MFVQIGYKGIDLRKITYFDPYFDQTTHEYDYSRSQKYTVTARSQDEYDAHMAALSNPARGITDISVEEAPPDIDDLKTLLAGTDYKAVKYAEGLIPDDEYAPVKAQRQVWRDEINRLESESKEEKQETLST